MPKKKDRNSKRIIDKKWVNIFQDYDILNKIDSNGVFEISSKIINQYKEARLMTKFDYINSLPDIFFENNLSILPTNRGQYIIGHFKAYESIDVSNKAFSEDRIELPFPEWIDTIDYTRITSEATMLNACLASGMLSNFLEEDTLLSTVSGRMSSEKFKFSIENSIDSSKFYPINVTNSQLEIDGGYETPNSLALIEAKNNVTSSFLVRQLYYPYRLWSQKISKPVLPIFLQYKNGTFNFSLYEFQNPKDYNSLTLIKRKNYIIGDDKLNVDDIVNILKTTYCIEEDPDIPFPQADSLDKILEMIVTIYESPDGEITVENLTLQMDFVYRQAFYYSTAGIYLDLIKRNKKGGLTLTALGVAINEKSTREKNLALIRTIASHKPFNLALKDYLHNMSEFNSLRVYDLIIENDFLSNYSLDTKKRRAQTIASWVKKIFSLTNDY